MYDNPEATGFSARQSNPTEVTIELVLELEFPEQCGK